MRNVIKLAWQSKRLKVWLWCLLWLFINIVSSSYSFSDIIYYLQAAQVGVATIALTASPESMISASFDSGSVLSVSMTNVQDVNTDPLSAAYSFAQIMFVH